VGVRGALHDDNPFAAERGARAGSGIGSDKTGDEVRSEEAGSYSSLMRPPESESDGGSLEAGHGGGGNPFAPAGNALHPNNAQPRWERWYGKGPCLPRIRQRPLPPS